jgi:hypothetical protein
MKQKRIFLVLLELDKPDLNIKEKTKNHGELYPIWEM